VKVTTGQRLPSAIDMAFADGHVARLALQDIKSVIWHRDYQPMADRWRMVP